MNKFETDGRSVVVSNIEQEAAQVEQFPVLIGNEVAYFHDVSGGRNSDRFADVLNLIHRVQGHGSPDRVGHADRIELHLDNYYHLDVAETRTIDEYPDRDYIVSVLVDSTMSGPYSFSEALSTSVDKREQRFTYE